MAVAALVKNGGADAGMGVYSAAHAMDLDFIPVGEEEYDFAVRKETLEQEEIRQFLNVLKSSEFRARAEAAGGYGLDSTGEILLL